MTKQEITFPSPWEFRLICESAQGETVKNLAQGVFAEFRLPAEFTPGGTSGSGKYFAWRISSRADSRDQLTKLCERLVKLPGVKYLL